MPTTSEDDKKRFDPYDPRTGATGNDEPMERGERSSPGSGEDEDEEGAADLQPDEVEDDDTAR